METLEKAVSKWQKQYRPDKRVFITVRLSEEIRSQANAILEDYDMSLNEYIRECLKLLIKEEGEK